jgi:SAM-dependent methyltransferase
MNCFCYSITCGSCLLLERELEEYQKRRLLMTPGDREELWKEKWTPWDRNGPSLALGDVLTEREDLVPPSRGVDADGAVRVKTALVPGCGRGHDALLLASFGYRVVGLDYAESAIEECIANEEAVGEEETYRAREGVVKGSVKWVSGDFFTDGFLASAGLGDMFDLIFDYTVSPPVQRLDTGSLTCQTSFCAPSRQRRDQDGPRG